MKRFPLPGLAPFAVCVALFFSGCGKTSTTTMTASDQPEPDGSPGPAPIKAETPGSQPPAPQPPPGAGSPELFASERAWWDKYKLNPDDPKVLAEDPDKDGFTNREEFLADTNPLDPQSRPFYATRLQVTEVKEVLLPVVLQSVEGKRAKIRLSGPPETTRAVDVGDRIPGLPFTVESVESKPTTDKFGEALDVSEVTLKNDGAGAKKTVLVKDMAARSPDTFAVLTIPGGESVKVMLDEVFSLSQEPEVKYRVLDIRKTEVVLQETGSRRVITVPPAATAPGQGQ